MSLNRTSTSWPPWSWSAQLASLPPLGIDDLGRLEAVDLDDHPIPQRDDRKLVPAARLDPFLHVFGLRLDDPATPSRLVEAADVVARVDLRLEAP